MVVWTRASLLRMGRIHLHCIESTVCGLTAKRQITFKEGSSFISYVNNLRTGNGAAKEDSELEAILLWSEEIEKLSITVQVEAGKAMHKQAKSRDVS